MPRQPPKKIGLVRGGLQPRETGRQLEQQRRQLSRVEPEQQYSRQPQQQSWLPQAIVQSYAVTPCRGIPIGNLTSQYFANLYLSYADRYLVHELKIPAYIRYMDDMLLWSDNRNELIEKGAALEKFVGDRLKLQLKPFVLNRCSHGLPALGFVLFPEQIRLNGRSKRRFERKMRENCFSYAAGGIDQVQFAAKMEALYAFIQHGCWHTIASRQMEKIRAAVGVEL